MFVDSETNIFFRFEGDISCNELIVQLWTFPYAYAAISNNESI